MMKPGIICLCLFFAALTLQAQHYNFRNYTVENGLPQSDVLDLVQDKDGQVWLATLAGLSKFNGITFTNYSKYDGLSSNNISCLAVDSSQNIWAGTFDKGVNRFDGSSFSAYGTGLGFPAGGVFGVTTALDGSVWFATAGGISCFNKGVFTHFGSRHGLPYQRYGCILADRQGNIWTATTGDGVYKYNGTSFEHYTTQNSALTNNIVYRLYQDKKDNIWIGTYGGVTCFNSTKFIPFTFDGDPNLNRGTDFYEDNFGNIWVALDGGGIIKLKPDGYERLTTKNGLRSNYITALLNDQEGNLWIGSSGGGLQCHSYRQFIHYGMPEGLPETNITSLKSDDRQRIWIGTHDGGAGFLKDEKLTWFTTKNGLPHNIVNHINTDNNGNTWLCTNKGTTKYNGKNFITYSTDHGLSYDIVTYCLPRSDGSIWFGTHKGISKWDGSRFTNFTNSFSKEANVINTLFEDSKGRFWIGSRGGLFLFMQDRFLPVTDVPFSEFNQIQAIAEDSYGDLWIASYNNGLLHYRPDAISATEKVQVIGRQQGLLHEGVSSLYIDGDNSLWIGTTKGLSRLNLTRLHQTGNYNFRSYKSSNGFMGIEVNSNAITGFDNGRLWIGTVKGLTSYLPQYDHINMNEPLLQLQRIDLFLQKTNWKQRGYSLDTVTHLPSDLKLPHNQNHLTFYFHGMCLTNPEAVRYRVKLSGFDQEWSDAGPESRITYSNLSPGDYTFLVKAANNNGIWNKEPLQYTFSIVPPFWSRSWFIIACLTFISASALSVVRLREKNFKKMNSLLEEKVQIRTGMLEKKNREKEVLLKEVHHRVKNNLQIITSLLNLQARHIKDPFALDVVREVKDRVKSMALLHQRLYRRDELEGIDLADYVQGLCKSLFTSYGVKQDQIELQCSILPLKLDLDTAITLGLIINELVSNTLKYAFPNNTKGKLNIKLQKLYENDYCLTLSDNGTGLPEHFEEVMLSSFGMQLVSSLSRKMNGKLKIYSDNGTKVRLNFRILPK